MSKERKQSTEAGVREIRRRTVPISTLSEKGARLSYALAECE
jgi:hypothetical protein